MRDGSLKGAGQEYSRGRAEAVVGFLPNFIQIVLRHRSDKDSLLVGPVGQRIAIVIQNLFHAILSPILASNQI